MNSSKLKANLIFIFATFGTFLGSRYVTKNYGSKIHAEYGETALATGIAGTAIYSANKISNAEVALGVIAGSGMNAVWMMASMPAVKDKLPQSIQATLGDDGNQATTVGQNSLDGYSDDELMGNERVVNIAREMAAHEKDAYINALMAAAQGRETKQLPYNQTVTVGAASIDYQTGLEGEEEMDGNSLD